MLNIQSPFSLEMNLINRGRLSVQRVEGPAWNAISLLAEHGGWEDKLPMFIKATGKGPAGTKAKAKASEKPPARQASRRTAASSGKRAKPMYREDKDEDEDRSESEYDGSEDGDEDEYQEKGSKSSPGKKGKKRKAGSDDFKPTRRKSSRK